MSTPVRTFVRFSPTTNDPIATIQADLGQETVQPPLGSTKGAFGVRLEILQPDHITTQPARPDNLEMTGNQGA